MEDLERVAGVPEGCVSADYIAVFDPASGNLAEPVKEQIRHWVEQWLPCYPGAVVLMAGNDRARNSDWHTRENRLRMLAALLSDIGISADRIRYTDEVIEVRPPGGQYSPDRGAIRMRAIRSHFLDGSVTALHDLLDARS